MEEMLLEYKIELARLEDLIESIGKRRKARAYVEGCIDSVKAIIRDLERIAR